MFHLRRIRHRRVSSFPGLSIRISFQFRSNFGHFWCLLINFFSILTLRWYEDEHVHKQNEEASSNTPPSPFQINNTQHMMCSIVNNVGISLRKPRFGRTLERLSQQI